MSLICSHLKNQLSIILRAKAAFDDALFIASQKTAANKFDKTNVNIAVQKYQEIEKLFVDLDKNFRAPIAFNCLPQEIAWGKENINENTKVYIGRLFRNIFKELKYPITICTDLRRGPIPRIKVNVGGNIRVNMRDELALRNISLMDRDADELISDKRLAISQKPEQFETVQVSMEELEFGVEDEPNYYDVRDRAYQKGLDICPDDFILSCTKDFELRRPARFWVIGMRPITLSNWTPSCFFISSQTHRTEVRCFNAKRKIKIDGNILIFCVRK